MGFLWTNAASLLRDNDCGKAPPTFADNTNLLVESLAMRCGTYDPHDVAAALNVVVLGDVEGEHVDVEWRRQRLRLWLRCVLHRICVQHSGQEQPWTWEQVSGLQTAYGLQLPADLQTVVLCVGWPPVFAYHLNPLHIYHIAHKLWRTQPPRVGDDEHSPRLMTEGGLLDLDDQDDKFTYVDLHDPVVGALFSFDGSADVPYDDAVVVPTGGTLLTFLLDAFKWVETSWRARPSD